MSEKTKLYIMLSIIYLLLLSEKSKVYVSSSSFVYQSPVNELQQVVSSIISEHFAHLKCISIIKENRNVEIHKFANVTSAFVLLLNKTIEDKFCDIRPMNKIIEIAIKQSCKGYVVQLSEPLCFIRTWKRIAKMSLHRHNPRILFLPTTRNSFISDSILREEVHQYEVALIEDYNNNSLTNKNFKIFNICYPKETLNVCSASQCVSNIKYLYPENNCNLKNKVLKVATFNYHPYVILTSTEVDGTEMRIVSEYARLNNCSFKIITDKAQWGEIYENGTGDGILGNVASERADFGIGALYLWYKEFKFLDYSVPYIRTGVTCIAPKPKLVSSLLLPVRPFHLTTWLVLICIFFLSCTTLYQVKKLETVFMSDSSEKTQRYRQWFQTKDDTILRAFGFIFFQAYASHTLETPAIRHLVNCLHITFLLVVTSYNSGLASILTVPSHLPPIDTVTDLVNSQFSWGATHDAWIFSLREAKEYPISTLVSRFQAIPKEQLKQHSFAGDFAFSVERLPAGHFAVGDYISEQSMKNLRLMKKDIYYEHCITVFQKGSPYLENYNTLVLRLLSSGLILFWEGEVARKFLNSSVQSAIKESSTVISRAHPTTIELRNLQSAFLILCSGLSLAFMIFIIEILFYFMDCSEAKKNQHKKKTKPNYFIM